MKIHNFRHFDQEFRTEHKLFLLKVGTGGGSIWIIERTRGNCFELHIDLGGASWLLEAVGEASSTAEGEFSAAKYRGSSYILLVEIYKNARGLFLRIMKIEDGKVRNLIIPA